MERSASPGDRFLETYSGPGGGIRRCDRRLLGTWNSILLVEGRGADPEQLDRAAASAFELMEGFEAELSKFEPESEVSLMNALAADGPVPVSARLFELLERSRRAWEATRGAFDPTVGPLMRAWGFDAHAGRVPEAAEIAALLLRTGMDKVLLDRAAGTVRFAAPAMAVDLGAIGKGWIVDRALERLRERGAAAGAILSGRSTIALWGEPPEGGLWRIGIAHPLDPERPLLELLVEPGAVSTSAAYERRFVLDGVEYGHVLDPRLGRPVRRCLSATVWTPDATAGDIASTALFVLGADEGAEVLPALGRASAVVIEEDSGVWGGLRWRRLGNGADGVSALREL